MRLSRGALEYSGTDDSNRWLASWLLFPRRFAGLPDQDNNNDQYEVPEAVADESAPCRPSARDEKRKETEEYRHEERTHDTVPVTGIRSDIWQIREREEEPRCDPGRELPKRDLRGRRSSARTKERPRLHEAIHFRDDV